MRDPAAADTQIRLAAFRWLEEQTAAWGDVLEWSVLLAGFVHRGERVPLLSQQGIFKPRSCELPLSIRTSVEGPYDDAFAPDGLLHYRYRGTDPQHRDNVGLRQAMRLGVPLVYLHGHVRGRYHTVWPVYIVGDDVAQLTFSVAADDPMRLPAWSAGSVVDEGAAPRRAYVTGTVRIRLHQHAFRERVLRVYHEQCALCRLRHRELLDAAHIVPDREPEGEPLVTNGLSLCKLHHAAFDGYLLTVDPDYRVVVRPDVLEEEDGPMLRHGLQGMNGARILAPRNLRDRPDRVLLERRLAEFRRRIA